MKKIAIIALSLFSIGLSESATAACGSPTLADHYLEARTYTYPIGVYKYLVKFVGAKTCSIIAVSSLESLNSFLSANKSYYIDSQSAAIVRANTCAYWAMATQNINALYTPAFYNVVPITVSGDPNGNGQ